MSPQSSSTQSFTLCPVTGDHSYRKPTINLPSEAVEINPESPYPQVIPCEFTRPQSSQMAPVRIEFYLNGVKHVEFEVLPGGKTMPRSFWQIEDDSSGQAPIAIDYQRATEEVFFY